ncbi:MAG: hypothetical protein LBH14_07770, partial [Desulfobulbaceae bacterium]|nr:hypothetical protein [Desulfobulbaceae bacterium]
MPKGFSESKATMPASETLARGAGLWQLSLYQGKSGCPSTLDTVAWQTKEKTMDINGKVVL